MISIKKIKNNELLFTLGIIFIIPIAFLGGIIERFEIYNKGEFVDVIITGKTHGHRFSNWIDFQYLDKNYSREISSAYYEKIMIGDHIKLKTLKPYKFFLLETERPRTRLVLTLLSFLIGMAMLIYLWVKND